MAAGVARRIRLEDHKKALLGTEQERERRHMEEVRSARGGGGGTEGGRGEQKRLNCVRVVETRPRTERHSFQQIFEKHVLLSIGWKALFEKSWLL